MAAGLAIGSGLQAIGALQQGQSTANSLDAQANLQIQNAAEAEAAGHFNAMRSTLNSNQKIGTITANYGASGVTSASGSVQSVLTASASNAEMDRLNILHGADLQAIQYENQASMERRGAQSAITGSIFSALGAGAKAGGTMRANSLSTQPSTSTADFINDGSYFGGNRALQ